MVTKYIYFLNETQLLKDIHMIDVFWVIQAHLWRSDLNCIDHTSIKVTGFSLNPPPLPPLSHD